MDAGLVVDSVLELSTGRNFLQCPEKVPTKLVLTLLLLVLKVLPADWFIGLLVNLHDQKGYTTNNCLVSCRISS